MAVTARKKGSNVPRRPTPRTASVTWTSQSLSHGQDHRGEAAAHAIVRVTRKRLVVDVHGAERARYQIERS